MKLADRTVETHSVGVSSTNQFNIAQTSKMFKILSDSLYSDKVMAVIRELSTNAYDSHVASGNKNPFKVTLPSMGNPQFCVRDYGTGLSQADMENLYTTYGASNKNDSNDFVGCLGLGSKSPFAYTKSFTTSSYYNGQKYTYVAAIDDSGVPTLNLFSVTDTNEPNGLEISFAVKQHDFHEFSSKAVRVFHYFKMKPIIEGGHAFNFDGHKYSNTNIVISGDGWRVCRLNNDTQYYPNHHHRIESGVIAIMGNIAYPVTVSQIIGEEKVEQTNERIQQWNRAFQKADIDSWKSFIQEILNQGLYLEIDCSIGELEMDVSREGLQYTKQVKRTLREKTQDIFAELKKTFSEKIAKAKTKIEAITTYYTMNDLAGGWGVGATWTDPNGKVHSIDSGKDIGYKIAAGKSLYVFNFKSSGYRSRRLVAQTDCIHHETLSGRGYAYWSSNKKNGKVSFFVCDVKSEESAKKIITRYCNLNDCFAYMMFDSKDHTKSGEGFDKLIEDVGSDNLLKVSDYKHLTQHSGPRKKSGVVKGSVSDQDIFLINIAKDIDGTSALNAGYNDACHMRSLSESKLDELVDEDQIIYIPIVRYASVDGFPEINRMMQWKDIVLSENLFDGQKIYAIKQASIQSMIKAGYNLVDFNKWFEDRLVKIKNKKFGDALAHNALVDKCRQQFNEADDTTYRSYNDGSIDRQFLFHTLNVFGLDYEKHIGNTKLVKILNDLMIMEFFADTIHRGEFDIRRFKQEDYYGHITKLLVDWNVNGLDSKKIKSANILYNQIKSMIGGFYAGNKDETDRYTKLLEVESSKVHTIPKMTEMRKSIKSELDKNPLFKYIITSSPTNGDIHGLDKGSPIQQVDGRYRAYGRYNKWFEEIDVEVLKTQVSSTIG